MKEEVHVMRCASCGDVFPLHVGDEERCPSCGSLDVHAAAEPLL